jgi:hypothetical protein
VFAFTFCVAAEAGLELEGVTLADVAVGDAAEVTGCTGAEVAPAAEPQALIRRQPRAAAVKPKAPEKRDMALP